MRFFSVNEYGVMDLDLSALPWLPRGRAMTARSLVHRLAETLRPPGMVAGHYQPLADDGPHTVRPSDQTCPLQSGQKTKKRRLVGIRSSSPPRWHEGESAGDGKWGRHPRNSILALLDLHLRAGVFQLLLRRFRVGLVDAFLDRLRCAVDQVLGFLQAQSCDLA